MSLPELHSLLLILVVAVVAPILCEWLPGVRLPLVVLEICLGILIGPQVLGWAEPGPTIQALAHFGLIALFFLAGFEVEFPALRGRPINAAVIGWLMSFGLGLGVGFGLQACGVVDAGLIVGAALTTTALGTIMPILRDAKDLSTRFGAYVVAAGALGEFGPIILIEVLFSSADGEHGGGSLLLMVVFAAIAIVGALIALNYRPPPLVALLQAKMDTSAQLPVRVAILVLACVGVVARNFGLDSILGALAAGVLVRLGSPGEFGKTLHRKLDGIGFGFFVPIFFVTTGLRYDLSALLSSRSALVQLPMFLGLFFVVRGLPALLVAQRDLDFRSRLALGLMSATQLPLVIAIAAIGIEMGRLAPETAASLVGAGMVSVLFFPMTALKLRKAAASGNHEPEKVAVSEPHG